MESSQPQFQKSSYSQYWWNVCVEVAFENEHVLVRDSKDPSGPVLTFTHDEWEAFIKGVKQGEFDITQAA